MNLTKIYPMDRAKRYPMNLKKRKKVIIDGGYNHTVGLKADGTVVVTGSIGGNVSSWRDIVTISSYACAQHIVGLKSDGTCVAVGYNNYGQCNVTGWRNIVAISCGHYHTVGLKSDGTCVAVGTNSNGGWNVSSWRDIVAVVGGVRPSGRRCRGSIP